MCQFQAKFLFGKKYKFFFKIKSNRDLPKWGETTSSYGFEFRFDRSDLVKNDIHIDRVRREIFLEIWGQSLKIENF